MIKVNSVIQITGRSLEAIQERAQWALGQTAEELHQRIDQDQVVPRMNGVLSGSGFFIDLSEIRTGTVYLVHSTPYARRLYYHPEYKFHREAWTDEVTDEDGNTHVYQYDGNANAKGKWFEDYVEGGREVRFVHETFQEFLNRYRP